MTDPDAWKERWRDGRIGFHSARVHPDLLSYGDSWLGEARRRVFVPLCGKTLDLKWLADQGHDVVGVELSELAVRAYCQEQGIDAVQSREGAFDVYRAERLTIYCGNYFDLTVDHIGADRVWDRASMIALPPELRSQYSRHLRTLVTGDWVLLLNTLEYDQSVMEGPPFSVTDGEVRDHYGDCAIRELYRRDVLDESPRWRELGHEVWIGAAYWISL